MSPREAISARALVLRSVPYRDSDVVLTLFTDERGKVSALARGARKSRRRFGAGIGLFAVSEMELTNRGGSEMWFIDSCKLVGDYTRLASDIVATAHASYALELVRELTAAEQADAAIFDLLVDLFDTLKALGPAPAVLRAFEIQLLAHLGLEPDLDRCVVCGRDDVFGDELFLDGVRGGLSCRGCARRGAPGVKPITEQARAFLRFARAVPRLADAHPGRPNGPGDGEQTGAAEARDPLLATVLSHVGKPLKSIEFIAKMSR